MKKDIANRADIELLVNTFYGKVEGDTLIGHIFNQIARVNWEHHLPKMYDFWETILFGKRSFKGNPMDAHFKLNELYTLKQEHFNRWIEIFEDSVDSLFEGDVASSAKFKARSIAGIMFYKINPEYNKGLN